jgi:hypothetical protein
MRDDEVLRAIAQLAAGEAAAATEDQVLQALRQLEQLQAKGAPQLYFILF